LFDTHRAELSISQVHALKACTTRKRVFRMQSRCGMLYHVRDVPRSIPRCTVPVYCTRFLTRRLGMRVSCREFGWYVPRPVHVYMYPLEWNGLNDRISLSILVSITVNDWVCSGNFLLRACLLLALVYFVENSPLL